MDLADFIRETQAGVRAQINDGGALYAELVFSEIVMQHLAEIGMTFDPVICHYPGRMGNAIFRLTGYAISEELDRLDMFVSLYEGVDTQVKVTDQETKTSAEQCLRFLTLCVEGKMEGKLDPSSDVYSLSLTIREIYNQLNQVRIFVLTDRIAASKTFKAREVGRKTVQLEVMDIERLFRHWSEGKPRDELIVDFLQLAGTPLACVYVPGEVEDYNYALAAIPAESMRFLYEKYGARLLEANIRSFLSVRGKGVNAGIQATLRTAPEKFMAYNNGIVLVVDDMGIVQTSSGSPGIAWMKGVQIVNGGQTVASLYFTKKKYPETDLSKVRIPAKIIVLKHQGDLEEETLISDISRFANTQNSVRQSDLSANKPFHVEVERLALTVYCPDGTGRWFYERANGSYNTLLAREGTTPSKLRALREDIPPSRKITKTDLAKYINAWEGFPDFVSLGSQKNFDKFIAALTVEEGEPQPIPTVADYKLMVAKTILYRAVLKVVRPAFSAFQANIVSYTVALLSKKLGNRLMLERIWERQSVSVELVSRIRIWASEVNEVLHRTAGGRMISEWAKKPECRGLVLEEKYSSVTENIPEIR